MRLLVPHGFIRGGDLLDWFGVLVIVDTGAGAGLLVEGDDRVKSPGVGLGGPLHVVGGQVAAVPRQPGDTHHPPAVTPSVHTPSTVSRATRAVNKPSRSFTVSREGP